MTSVQTLFAPLDHREHVPPEYRPGTLAQSQGFVGYHRIQWMLCNVTYDNISLTNISAR